MIDWSQVWREHGQWLRTVLLARLRDPHAVDEVFQEMAVIVARKPHRWPEPTKIGAWLYRVAVRQVQLHRRQRLRGRRRMNSLNTGPWDPLDQDAIDPATWLIDREAESHVKTALARLSDQDREMLMLRHNQQWTYRQISDHLGLSQDKVVYRLARAHQSLKSELATICSDWVERSVARE